MEPNGARTARGDNHGPEFLNMRSLYETPPLIIDFESRSDADLEEVGGRLYWLHPSTEPICCCMYYEGERLTWLPGDEAPGTFRVIVAHNASTFDRFGWAWLGWPEPELWVDSASQARKAGLKAGLGALARRMLDDEKDKEGNKLTIALSRHKVSKWADIPEDCRDALKEYYAARKALPGEWPEIPAVILQRVAQYCGTDVDQLVRVYEEHLASWVDCEADVERVDRIINDRGMCFDRELAAALLAIDARQAEAACEALGLTAKELRSNDQFPELVLLAGGPQIPNCKFETVEELTRHPNEVVRALAEARISLSSIARGKLTAGMARTSSDGRMRDAMKFAGAHAQPNSEPIMTRDGQTTMGAVCVGDIVLGPSGPVAVTAKFPQGERDVFRVTFSDGTWTRCDAEHLWDVRTRAGVSEVVRTRDMAVLRRQGRACYQIPLASVPFTDRSQLPIDPYTLGALLGDGTLCGKTPRFTSQDPEIVAEFILPPRVRIIENSIEGKRAKHYRLSTADGCRTRSNPLTDQLKALGLWGVDSFTKFVPTAYIVADRESRIALLQGLFDTDGSAKSAGVVIYATCSQRLRDAVVSMVQSLGGTASVYVAPLNGSVIYAVNCHMPIDVCAFRLERKSARHSTKRRPPWRAVVSIEPDGREECSCISVAGERYLTRSYIVTHNTWRWAHQGLQPGNIPWIDRRA